MDSDELNKLMRQLSDDAAFFSKSEYGIELGDDSVAEVKKVDSLITKLKQRGSESFQDEELFTLSNVFGAYVGEVVKLQVGGQWLYDLSDDKAPSVRLIIGHSDYAFASLVYRHLVGSPEISIYDYAFNAIDRHNITTE